MVAQYVSTDNPFEGNGCLIRPAAGVVLETRKQVVYRSAVNGEFEKKQDAVRHPRESVREVVKIPTPPPKPKGQK